MLFEGTQACVTSLQLAQRWRMKLFLGKTIQLPPNLTAFIYTVLEMLAMALRQEN